MHQEINNELHKFGGGWFTVGDDAGFEPADVDDDFDTYLEISTRDLVRIIRKAFGGVFVIRVDELQKQEIDLLKKNYPQRRKWRSIGKTKARFGDANF